MKQIAALIASAIVTLHALATPATQPHFETAFWLGPPEKFTTLERYREIKEANFTIAFPPLTTPSPQLNHKILDLCRQTGLRAMIADTRMVKSMDDPHAAANLDAIVKDYSQHPALFGYFITDEPTAGDFPKLAKIVAYLHAKDPKHPAYINLFPTYAAPWSQLGTKTYEEYLDRFITTVHPTILSYDHYALIKSGDRGDFFQNLALVRNAATKYALPFWNIVLCTQHYDYRHLTEPELRYEAMQTLAFGGRGLLWYTYWYPGRPNAAIAHAMISYDGSRDPHYEMIKQINADAAAIGTELLDARSWATYHVGDAIELQAPPQGTPLSLTCDGKVTVGLFTLPDKRWMALLANRDYAKASNVRISRAAVEQFDVRTKRWTTSAPKPSFQLAPGSAVLIRFAKDE